MFGFQKVLRRKKNTKENYFILFGFIMKNIKRNSNIIKIS